MTNRKLGRTTGTRMSMLRTLTTDLIWHEQIETTEAKAKVDSKGNKETELVKSKNGKEFLKVVKETTTKKVQKDKPSRLNARRKMMTKVNKVKDSDGVSIDLTDKLFNVIAPRYASRVGGFTKIVKVGQRRGDGAETVILKLV